MKQFFFALPNAIFACPSQSTKIVIILWKIAIIHDLWCLTKGALAYGKVHDQQQIRWMECEG